MSDINNLPNQEYLGSNIVQCRPLENITKGAFSGQCTFVLDIPKDEVFFCKSLYMVGRVSLSKLYVTDGNPPSYIAPLGRIPAVNGTESVVGCIAPNGINNLFSKLQHEISGLNGSSVVQNIENYPQCVSMLRLNHEYPLSPRSFCLVNLHNPRAAGPCMRKHL